MFDSLFNLINIVADKEISLATQWKKRKNSDAGNSAQRRRDFVEEFGIRFL